MRFDSRIIQFVAAVCRVAAQRGWKIQRAAQDNVTGIYQFTFVHGNRRVIGKSSTNEKLALSNAAVALESYGFLRD